MIDPAQTPTSDENGILEAGGLDDAREIALTQALLRAQEQHREGGPETEPESGAGMSDT